MAAPDVVLEHFLIADRLRNEMVRRVPVEGDREAFVKNQRFWTRFLSLLLGLGLLPVACGESSPDTPVPVATAEPAAPETDSLVDEPLPPWDANDRARDRPALALLPNADVWMACQVVDGEGPEFIEGAGHVDCVFEDGLPLLPGRYQFCGCAYGDGGNVTLLRWTTFTLFSITREGFGEVPPERAGGGRAVVVGPVRVKHRWHTSGAAGR